MRKSIKHSISGVFVFLLLGIFAVFGTVMVLLGAKVYRGISADNGVHGTSRITSSYLRSMIRGDDEEGALAVEPYADGDMLVLRNTYDGDAFVTRIYVHEGMLYEWFAEAEAAFEPENGEAICPAEGLRAVLEGNRLSVSVQSDGAWREVDIALRTRKGED